MGREIRRVPPNFEHPRDDTGKFKPMHNQSFADAAKHWKEEFADWERGVRPDYCTDPESRALEYWEYSGTPPDREYYLPYEPATLGDDAWFAVYETVSEGTPVTPAFATKAELIDYLVASGDFWDQRRGDGGWRREAATKFVGDGWAPSFVAHVTPAGADIRAPRDNQFPAE